MLNTLVCLGRIVFIAKQTIKNVKDTREDADLLWDQLDRLDKLLETIPPEAQTCESVDRALKVNCDMEWILVTAIIRWIMMRCNIAVRQLG